MNGSVVSGKDALARILLLATTVFFFSIPAYAQVPIAVLEQDSLALVALYNATGGPEGVWENDENWLSGPVGTWFGITATEQRVIRIDLTANLLSGPIPPEIGDLSKLEALQLGSTDSVYEYPTWNQLTGTIPPEVGKLSNLLTLQLDYNLLSGPIPDELGKLVKLKVLKLTFNRLSGPIPPDLGMLSDLVSLDLSSNILGGTIPSELGNLTQLTHLGLYRCDLTGAIPPELGNLVNLESLNLGINNLKEEIPSELGNLTKLRSFSLQENQLSGSIPLSFTALTELDVFLYNKTSLCEPADDGFYQWHSHINRHTTMGPCTTVGTEDETELPREYALDANYPNPFNPSTSLSFALPENANVGLVVYDVLGREVARLVNGPMTAGRHTVTWEAGHAPSGVYVARLTAGSFVQERTMVLAK